MKSIDDWEKIAEGKVRELYAPKFEHPKGDVILVVASNRISAFDFILDAEIPLKGAALTRSSVFWFYEIEENLNIPTHFISVDDESIPEVFRGRAMLCKRLKMIPAECVARGFLTGSAFQEYAKTGKFQEFDLPSGLKDGAKLDKPIFSPATKAAVGDHDENISFDTLAEIIGEELAEKLRSTTLKIFEFASKKCEEVGLTLVDTKFEFGIDPSNGELTLGDEALTPDSSRYLDENAKSFDKQYVRDWLLNESGWVKESGDKPPALPHDVVGQTSERYLDLLQRFWLSISEGKKEW
ncbi:MAG: phosphoribosylaminoimidazolesuccinocarboxamide synthase [Candidatus Ancillula sp.]|jgi:phosphoribosylaminoimidazole-succinocarboxamide synthase|nr:phosphoribosylaminoimidazolesuccinocarboxamide synthase [Candidatus Ancillula sp.]